MMTEVKNEGKSGIFLIMNLQEKKSNLIRNCLGMLYKGNLNHQLSFRKGEIFYYGRKSFPNLNEIKEIMLRNIHDISKKTTDENMDILELLLFQIEDTNPHLFGKISTEDYISNLKEDIEEIKHKCGNLLMLLAIEDDGTGTAQHTQAHGNTTI